MFIDEKKHLILWNQYIPHYFQNLIFQYTCTIFWNTNENIFEKKLIVQMFNYCNSVNIEFIKQKIKQKLFEHNSSFEYINKNGGSFIKRNSKSYLNRIG